MWARLSSWCRPGPDPDRDRDGGRDHARRLRALPGPDRIVLATPPYDGLSLRVHDPGRDDYISPSIRAGGWEGFETFCLWHLLAEGRVFYDIGANLGWYTAIASRRVGPRGRVLAFEPDPENFLLLWRNVTENELDNVDLFAIAVGDRDGRGLLALSPTNKGDHRVDSVATDRHTIDIAVGSLATLLDAGAPPPDVMKIDTQGSEARILDALPALVAARPELALAVEFWPHGLAAAGSSVADLIAILDAVPLRFLLVDGAGERLVPVELAALAGRLAGEEHADLLAVPAAWQPPRVLEERIA
ncbi:MAG: FkbM family methyltransferase [Rhizobiales bacterium]|nr:FkbM family methyltransferase [Hyphomicrobiales bacterium]